MFRLTLPAVPAREATEYVNAAKARKAVVLELEHSLVSLSKWEQIYEKPFYDKEPKTPEETHEYIRLMVVKGKPPKDLAQRLTQTQINEITIYINAKQSATWFREEPGRGGPEEAMTSELIYYWLTSFRIPFQPTETWHLNRLITLVRIAGIKQTKPKPMSKREQAEQYRKINEQRRRDLGTSG